MIRTLLLAILLLATAFLGEAFAQTDGIPCIGCEYMNPVENKFCNKCGASLDRLAEPGAKGRIVSIDGKKVVIDAGSGEGIEKGDLLEVRETIEAILSPDTGDTLGFRRKPTALINVNEVSFRVSQGNYWRIGSRDPCSGDAVHSRDWSFRDRRLVAAVLIGLPYVDEEFPIGPAHWEGDIARCVQVEYILSSHLGLGVQLGDNALRDDNGDYWSAWRVSPFVKLSKQMGRHSIYAKSLLGVYFGTYSPVGDPDFGVFFRSIDGKGMHVEIAGGYRISIGSRFGILAEYSVGRMYLPGDSPAFIKSSGTYFRLDGGFTFAIF